MPDSTHSTSQHPRPHAVSMASPYLEFDLDREIRQLHEEKTWNTGRNSKTLVKYTDFRVVLMALKAGIRIAEHQSQGRISVQTVAGHITVRASGRTFDLPTGSLLTLDRAMVHDVEALDESAILITIAWPEESKGQQTTG